MNYEPDSFRYNENYITIEDVKNYLIELYEYVVQDLLETIDGSHCFFIYYSENYEFTNMDFVENSAIRIYYILKNQVRDGDDNIKIGLIIHIKYDESNKVDIFKNDRYIKNALNKNIQAFNAINDIFKVNTFTSNSISDKFDDTDLEEVLKSYGGDEQRVIDNIGNFRICYNSIFYLNPKDKRGILKKFKDFVISKYK